MTFARTSPTFDVREASFAAAAIGTGTAPTAAAPPRTAPVSKVIPRNPSLRRYGMLDALH